MKKKIEGIMSNVNSDPQTLSFSPELGSLFLFI